MHSTITTVTLSRLIGGVIIHLLAVVVVVFGFDEHDYEEEDNESVRHLFKTMLIASELVYTYAMVRDIVNTHDNVVRCGKPKLERSLPMFSPKEEPLVEFYKPELVVTQHCSMDEPDDDPDIYLRHPIHPSHILEFIRNNRNFLKEDQGGNIIFQNVPNQSSDTSCSNTPLEIEDDMKVLSRFDGHLIDYDDQFTGDAGLVYAVTINRTIKRIAVIFRGTVGGRDMWIDANFLYTRPEIFKNHTDPRVQIHMGFSTYLFDNLPGEGRSKFDRIVVALKKLYQKIPENERDDYDVFVSGHSLGGALCNLFSFAIAATQQDYKFFDQITAISFAAPVVGNNAYNRAVQALERSGRLKHIRISNQGDVVPSKPLPGFTQNGVNLHLYDNGEEMDTKYGNTKSLFSQLSFKFLRNHGFPEYEKRLFETQANQNILSMTLHELYSTVGGNFSA